MDSVQPVQGAGVVNAPCMGCMRRSCPGDCEAARRNGAAIVTATLPLDEFPPTPEAAEHIEGATLLDEVLDAIRKFVVLPTDHAVAAVVLWIVATHALSVFEHATRLAIHSAVKRSGKSRLLEIIEALVYEPLATTNITVAPLFRTIQAAGDSPPTLILDEADRLFGSAKKDEDNGDLIALLNNGFRRGRPTIRCVGPMQTPTPFSNYAMAVIAGIGRKPDTIEDRAVNITMRRRLPSEKVEKFRLRTDRPALEGLRERVAAWVAEHLDAIEKPVVDMPDELEDRAEDAWEPLLAVADAAGGRWPALARAAAVALTADANAADENTEEIRLLADIRDVFERMGSNGGFVPTSTLMLELRKVEDAPWADERFTARRLADRLATFDIRPGRNTTGTARGYHRSDFRDAFARHLQAGEASEPSEASKTGSELGKRLDGDKPSDGLKRQTVLERQEESAGQTPNLPVQTLLTDTPPEAAPRRSGRTW